MITNLEFYQEYPGLALSLLVTAALLVFLALSLLVYYFIDKRHRLNVKIAINPTRIYVVDFANDRSIYFDKRKFARRIEGSTDLFFHQFENSAVEGLRNWLENLLIDEDTPLFYEADVNVAKLKMTFFSLLQVLKIDRNRKIIYLESYLLKYLRPRHQINRKLDKHNRSYFRNYEKVAPIYRKARSKNRGILMMIRFFKIQKRQENDVDLEKLLSTQMKDYLMLFLSSSRVMFDYDEVSIGFFDSKAKDPKRLNLLANSIQHHLRSFMKLNGYEGYSFSIGVAEARLFASLEDIIDIAKGAAFLAESKNQLISFHDNLQPETGISSDYMRTELDNFIKEKKTQTTLRPIIFVEDTGIFGYLSYVEPKQSVFNSYRELTEYAIKAGREKEIFNVIVKRLTSLFSSQGYKADARLFIPAQLINRDSIIHSLKKISHVSEIALVLVFDSEDIESSLSRIEEVRQVLEEIKKTGFEIAIVLGSTELTLPNSIYGLIDHFIVDDNLLRKTYKNERNRLYLLSALGKLLRYNKPIILSDLQTWSDIEYFVRAGVNYVSSDQISEKSGQNPHIEKKKLQKISSLSRKR